MPQFAVRFFASGGGEPNMISAPLFMTIDSMDEALEKASIFMQGMCQIDYETHFTIASVELIGAMGTVIAPGGRSIWSPPEAPADIAPEDDSAGEGSTDDGWIDGTTVPEPGDAPATGPVWPNGQPMFTPQGDPLNEFGSRINPQPVLVDPALPPIEPEIIEAIPKPIETHEDYGLAPRMTPVQEMTDEEADAADAELEALSKQPKDADDGAGFNFALPVDPPLTKRNNVKPKRHG